MERPQKTALISATCLLAGCFNAMTTRLPRLTPRAAELERRESQIQDPYPDSDIGPDVDFRPRDFQQQRPETQRYKDRSYSAFVRTHTAQPTPAPLQLPPPGPAPGPAPAP